MDGAVEKFKAGSPRGHGATGFWFPGTKGEQTKQKPLKFCAEQSHS